MQMGWGCPATFQPTQSSPIWLKVFGVNLVPICADCAGFDGYTGSYLLCRLCRKLLILHGMEEVVGSIPTRSTKFGFLYVDRV